MSKLYNIYLALKAILVYVFKTYISKKTYKSSTAKQIASFQIVLYSNFVNFNVIKSMDIIKISECVAMEYKFSNKMYWLLNPTPG